jgi:hypothetical protein
MVISLGDAQIKVEPNLRGSVYPPETRDLCADAPALFE